MSSSKGGKLLFCMFSLICFTSRGICLEEPIKKNDLLVLTVATSPTDGYLRYLRSAKAVGLNVKTLGLGARWLGGSMKSTGGGHKVNLLLEEVKKHKNDKDKIILFTDSYDVVFLGDADAILQQFYDIGGKVVFGAEPFCWPDSTLQSEYPFHPKGKRFLNSGGIIGYAPELYKILTRRPIADHEDDQLFFTQAYLDESLRNKLKIKLDHYSQIFHNLNGAMEELSLKFKNNEPYLENVLMKTSPLIIHGNGPAKVGLSNLGNYLPKVWNLDDGCLECKENTISLPKNSDDPKFPKVYLAVFISKAMPFLEEFFRKVEELDYPKNKMSLFLYNNVLYHEEQVQKFLDKFREKYSKVKEITPDDEIGEAEAKTLAVEDFLNTEYDYYFYLDSDAHLDNPLTLRLLIEQNRSIIAPMLVRPFKAWSNFWGSIAEDGYYLRSFDYMVIINNEKRGLWNVPYISSCYLINGSIIRDDMSKPNYGEGEMDPDMSFCHHMREKGKFMYVSNRVDFGHLINPSSYDTTKTHPDFYQLLDNKLDWEKRYLHVNYTENLNPDTKALMPCQDVYWFPVASPRFCRELIEICETYGKWSDGTNKDSRLEGGYENVPTRDIHMKQLGLEYQWLYFLKEYVRPLQEKVFLGYYHDDDRIEGGYEAVPTRDIHMKQVGLEENWLQFLEDYVAPLNEKVFDGYSDEVRTYSAVGRTFKNYQPLKPPKAIMNFVVRYKPDEQPSLRPHHDSSTYTINLALNTPNVDYEGGGCRFLRYNCNVTNTRLGWLLMHPGRLTHYHEGLLVTKGIRYIMVSFVDP